MRTVSVTPLRTRVVAVAAIVAAAAWFAWFAVYQVDDAFIVYRYAENLARGEGFVYNPGEPVEGVTCFLWAAILAPFAAAGVPLPWVAPIMTALCGLGILILLPGFTGRLRQRNAGSERGAPSPGGGAAGARSVPDGWNLAPAVLLAAHPTFAYWSVGALEAVPYALLIVLAMRDHMDELDRGHGRRSALWIGLATLLRPEAPLIALAFALDRMLPAEGGPSARPGGAAGSRFAAAAGWLGVVGLFFIPFLAFRRFYFGEWLPMTYYAKTGGDVIRQIDEGWKYTLRFMAQVGPGFGETSPFTAVVGVLMVVVCLAHVLPRPRLRPAGLAILAIAFAVLIEGGDWMVLHRFWVPGLVLLLPLLVVAGRDLAAQDRRLRPAVVACGALLLVSFVVGSVRARAGANGLAVNGAGYRYAHEAVGRYLLERGTPDDTVALMDIGIIGYVSGLRVFDITGLTEPSVAKSPGGFLRKDYPAELVLARRPRFIVLVNGFTIDARIAAHPEFLRDYVPVFERNHQFNWTPPGDYTLRVFERRDGISVKRPARSALHPQSPG